MKKLFIISILSILFFVGCKRCKTTSLPENIVNNYPTSDDLSWISFNNGDTLIYKSNFGNFDTVTVKIDPDFYSGGPYQSGIYSSCETYSLNWVKMMGFYLTNSDTSIRFIVFYSPNSLAGLFPKIVGYNLKTTLSYLFGMYNPISLSVNGFNYDNVLELSGDSLDVKASNIWRFYYQKENGLLRFDQLGGIKWERIN